MRHPAVDLRSRHHARRRRSEQPAELRRGNFVQTDEHERSAGDVGEGSRGAESAHHRRAQKRFVFDQPRIGRHDGVHSQGDARAREAAIRAGGSASPPGRRCRSASASRTRLSIRTRSAGSCRTCGAITGETPTTRISIEKMRRSCEGGNRSRTMAREMTDPPHAPMACSSRKNDMIRIDGANAHAAEETMNSARLAVQRRLAPEAVGDGSVQALAQRETHQERDHGVLHGRGGGVKYLLHLRHGRQVHVDRNRRESLQHSEQKQELQMPESRDGSGLLRDHWRSDQCSSVRSRGA